ncbi:MAG: phosphatase [Acidimicrobiia bacterium]|nr:MAG: phosphatase [Acidimicrobiia bacterium]
MPHVVWDWNGTLVDDLGLVVEAVNGGLGRFGLGPIGPDDYRRHYARPVRTFYERLFGRAVTDEEWSQLDAAFHEGYRRRLHRLRLRTEAPEALKEAARRGYTQSVLSMFLHDELVELVERLAIASFFLRVDGAPDSGRGEAKASYLEAHLARLGVPAREVLVVGDSLDDADAAAAVGTRCVLLADGSHPIEVLQAAGHPVVGSLLEAIDLV